ncbi:hypothetical protein GCM10009623_02300 [Nocardioides aestuarii]|uniref:Uncharacterized protein n=1 Tax=Nocardioides aestuarii TaxID=252231 RepID=A0ABW4TGR1_9ACTN
MKLTRRTRTAVALAAAATAVLTSVAPASAETYSTDDGADATASLTDMRKVRITHGTEKVSVRITYPNLKKRGQAIQTVYLDKNPDRRGPEFALTTPLFSGSDYALVRMRKWKISSDGPIDCAYSVDLRWRRDVAVVEIDRDCLGSPDELRVALRMKDLHDGSHPITDWLGDRREFTGWLASGSPAA